MSILEAKALGKLQIGYPTLQTSSFPTRHVEELLGFLLMNQQKMHPRETLITILWPSCSASEGRPRLSTVLWRLRGIFKRVGVAADTFLQTTREWVAFMPQQEIWFDVARFDAQIEAAQQATTVARREAALRAALALYDGDFCEGLYTDWCVVERERLARHHLRARAQLMSICMDGGEYLEAVDHGQQILSEDPLREDVHRSLMYCYLQMGRRTEALQQFKLCASQLMQELQVIPARETLALYGEIERARVAKRRDWQGSTAGELAAAFADFQRASRRLNALLAEREPPSS